MANKKFWFGMLVMVLVFGMAVVGCSDGNDNGNGTIFDAPDGIWDFVIFGENATITIIGNNWVFSGTTQFTPDSGTFTRSGNIATLFSTNENADIGIATLTSNTTMRLLLIGVDMAGGFAGTKR